MAKAKTSITTENRSGSAADAAAKEKRTELPLSDLHPFEGHPFKVLDDELMEQTVESIKQIGVVSPLIVRPDPEGGFEILSGHRRLHAAQLAGLETVPVIVKEMDDDAAIIFMVDSNLQRENILPSERAFSYKMKLEAMKHQGERGDLTSAQVGAVDKVTFILVLTNKKDAHRRHPACFIIRFRFNAVADKRQWSSAASKPRRKTRAKLCSRFCAENEPSHQTCRSFSASR